MRKYSKRIYRKEYLTTRHAVFLVKIYNYKQCDKNKIKSSISKTENKALLAVIEKDLHYPYLDADVMLRTSQLEGTLYHQ